MDFSLYVVTLRSLLPCRTWSNAEKWMIKDGCWWPLMEHHSPCWRHVKLMPWTEAWGGDSKQHGGAADGTFCFCLFSPPSPTYRALLLHRPLEQLAPPLPLYAFVCSDASFSVHCYPINVSIFVQLYMECKPVKPLARPRVGRHFSSAGSKRLQWLCVLRQVLHIHRASTRARLHVGSLQVKLARVVDKPVVALIFFFFFLLCLLGLNGRSEINYEIILQISITFCFVWIDFTIPALWLPLLSSLSCPTVYSDLILDCASLSYLVLCSFVLLFLACLALSWSIVSFLICTITSYPVLSCPAQSYSISSHTHQSAPPLAACPIQMFCQDLSNTPNRMNWTERSLAYTYSKLSSPLMFLLHFISVLVGWETSF